MEVGVTKQARNTSRSWMTNESIL